MTEVTGHQFWRQTKLMWSSAILGNGSLRVLTSFGNSTAFGNQPRQTVKLPVPQQGQCSTSSSKGWSFSPAATRPAHNLFLVGQPTKLQTRAHPHCPASLQAGGMRPGGERTMAGGGGEGKHHDPFRFSLCTWKQHGFPQVLLFWRLVLQDGLLHFPFTYFRCDFGNSKWLRSLDPINKNDYGLQHEHASLKSGGNKMIFRTSFFWSPVMARLCSSALLESTI